MQFQVSPTNLTALLRIMLESLQFCLNSTCDRITANHWAGEPRRVCRDMRERCDAHNELFQVQNHLAATAGLAMTSIATHSVLLHTEQEEVRAPLYTKDKEH